MRIIDKELILFLFVAIGLVISFAFGYRMAEGRNEVSTIMSRSRFSQLSLALKNYHLENGTFPPPLYSVGPGAPLHSWRVLLIGCCDERAKAAMSKYRFTEEWNSPDNLTISKSLSFEAGIFSMAKMEPKVYANYLSVSQLDPWPSKKPLSSMAVISPAGDEWFLLVEDPDSNISWAEPTY